MEGERKSGGSEGEEGRKESEGEGEEERVEGGIGEGESERREGERVKKRESGGKDWRGRERE